MAVRVVYGLAMPTVGREDQELELLVERFLGYLTEGRGDLARGRHLHLLRALDALWDPDAVIDLPYRPTRNPGAFLAMTFDLAGDACHGYSLLLDGGGSTTREQLSGIAAHVRARLRAPWPRHVAELRRLGMHHLGAMLEGFVPDVLERSPLSRLPTELARLAGRMTARQASLFDRRAYLVGLPFARVLDLLGWHGERAAPSGREQHPTGGDLRSLLRRRLDAPWAAALRLAPAVGPVAVLATMPTAPERLTEVGGEGDFAVSYALSSDAPAPGRRWPAPAPYVTDDGRDEFEYLTGRGAADDAADRAIRREIRLERAGASLMFPESYARVDALLETTPGLEPLHAGGSWRELVKARAEELAAARLEFTHRVAEQMAVAT